MQVWIAALVAAQEGWEAIASRSNIGFNIEIAKLPTFDQNYYKTRKHRKIFPYILVRRTLLYQFMMGEKAHDITS